MLGLRGMYFLVQDLVETFHLLKYGLGFILVVIGLQLIVSSWFDCPPLIMLGLILTVFVMCIIGSKLLQLRKPSACAQVESMAEAGP
eukprot:4862776-Amphidinium_carterae.1